MRVLAVVDEHAEVRNLVRLLFERSGAPVIAEAATTGGVLARIDPKDDGVIIVAGVDAARELRARAPHARIILFTADGLDEREAEAVGIDAIVPKDQVLQLVTVARELLDTAQAVNPVDAVLVAWLERPALVFGTLPPPLQAAVVLDALTPGAERSPSAVSAFVAACGDVDVAVAHLLVLRRLVDGEPAWRAAVDRDALDLLIVEATRSVLAEARRAAMLDPLTRIGNRAALEVELASALARAERTGNDLSLVYFDLVGLKAINDRRGHAAGDARLRDFAAAINASKRTGDGAYRVGGDEFIAVLPDTGSAAADAFIERLEASDAPTFSWGLASAGLDGFDAARLTRLADLRMLQRRYARGQSARAETIDLSARSG